MSSASYLGSNMGVDQHSRYQYCTVVSVQCGAYSNTRGPSTLYQLKSLSNCNFYLAVCVASLTMCSAYVGYIWVLCRVVQSHERGRMGDAPYIRLREGVRPTFEVAMLCITLLASVYKHGEHLYHRLKCESNIKNLVILCLGLCSYFKRRGTRGYLPAVLTLII